MRPRFLDESMCQLRTKGGKRDLVKNWSLPDKVFFACGACHILAHAFLKAYPTSGFAPVWIRPAEGYTGTHIVVVREQLAFDYHGYSDWVALLAHYHKRASQRWPGWHGDLVELSPDVLVSEAKSRSVKGLWLREPKQFLFDALPRAEQYLKRLPAPDATGAARFAFRSHRALERSALET